MTVFADIAFRRRIPHANDGLFTFAVPEKFAEKIEVGCIALAPLRSQLERAVVVHIHDKKPLFDTEEIVEICTPKILEDWQFQLAEKVAKKNFVSLARVIPLLLPNKIFLGNGKSPEKTIITLLESDSKERIGKTMTSVIKVLSSTFQNNSPNHPYQGGINGGMEINELLRESGGTKKTIERLEEKGLVRIKTVPVMAEKYICDYSFPPLTDEQKEAYGTLKKADASLLFAPTGSGKSHLLRMLAHEKLEERKTALFVVPEIGLTEEVVQKCNEIFGEKNVALYHSRLSEGEKAKVFWRVKTGMAKVIVGSRASLFLPFQNLGLIALEEEHEWTLKSDQSPRYHAKDVCKYLAELHNAQLILSSATPSLESITNEKLQMRNEKDSQFITLPSRTQPPNVTIIDLKEETLAKNPTLVSRALQLKMKETLQKNQQVLLFLNRRGFHRTLICQDCSEIVRCPSCGISLVLHEGKGKEFLLCHYCGKVFGVPEKCGYCQSTRIGYLGSGTAKIERMIQNLFPEKKVTRIDRDTTSNKAGFADLYSDVISGEADILIGTQIIAKGIDFENMGLVGILDADAGMHIPDFRSAERTYQLLTQVIGRAGRRGQQSEVVLQTRIPKSPIFEYLKKGDTIGFLEEELKVREKFFLPPFSRIIKLIFVGPQKDTVFKRARETEQLLHSTIKRKFSDEKVEVSVAPALHPKKHGKYYVNVLVTAKNPEEVMLATPLKGCRVDNDPVDSVG